MEEKKIHLTSVDLPYLKHMPKFKYNSDDAKKTAMGFIRDAAIKHSVNYQALPAFNFYGKNITHGQFFDGSNMVGNAFLNCGVTPDDVVPMFCLNTPETFMVEYGLNDMGICTEWFNPGVVSKELLYNYLVKNKTKALVIIDVMYPVVKEAIKGTNVEHVIVTSVMDSFPLKMNLGYQIQVFGLNAVLNNPYYKHAIKGIEGFVPSERELNDLSIDEQRKVLKKYQQLLLNFDAYAKKQKIMAKASFYKDDSRDDRFIQWEDFLKIYGEMNYTRAEGYQDGKVKFIVHTGGTTGPAKRVAMTDLSCNTPIYQTTLMTTTDYNFEDSFCQLCPPMVAYSLEGMHLARYYQMNTHLIATYDRNEFPKTMLKTKANHYFAVPSFVKTLVEDPKWATKDFSFVKSVQHGGEGIEAEIDEQVDKILNGRSRHGYGQNEEFGGVIFNYDIPGVPKKYGTCGFPLAGSNYIVIDKFTGEELPYGKDEDGNYHVGEFLLSTDASMLGYIDEAPEVNEKTICYRDGKKYIDTGDEAYIDEEGRLCFVSREERIIRTQNGKIFVNVLENIINNIPEVLECCVVKSPHPSNVAEASCHIVLKEECFNQDIDKIIEKIIKIVEEKTKPMYYYYIPGTYEFRKDRLPLTPFGKTAFRELEQQNALEYEMNNGKALKKVRVKM